MSNPLNGLGELIHEMRNVYKRGENVMQFARKRLSHLSEDNSVFATLVSYDLQAGTYVENARLNPEHNKSWGRQAADAIEPFLRTGGSVLEVGCGEATTLGEVLRYLDGKVTESFGFDISWSRIQVAQSWLAENNLESNLFVADIQKIPLASNSVDVVYSSHSIEANGGRESELIAECLRVAKQAVVLIEPIYELASHQAQERMTSHGYVRGLRVHAEKLGAEIIDYRLLDIFLDPVSPLNPSGLIAIRKLEKNVPNEQESSPLLASRWSCPISAAELSREDDCFIAKEIGVAYPILRSVPLLAAEHAVIASKISTGPEGFTW